MEVLRACSCVQSADQDADMMDIPDPEASSDSAGSGQQVTADTAKTLAVLLVEMVTPDVMYNTILWPEEEFLKVTVER